MAGVDEDVVIAKKTDGQVFVRRMAGGGVGTQAEDGVPPGVGVEEFGDGLRAQLALEMSAIFPDAIEELGTQRVALGEQSGERGLGWRA